MAIRWVLAALAITTVAVPVVAQAQMHVLEVPADKKWKHAASGIIVPQQLGGHARTEIADTTQEELDVIVKFATANDTDLTLYLYRPALMSVPVWLDCADTQIVTRDVYGKGTEGLRTIAFAPPGSTVTSAMRRVYKPGKPPYRSTGVAIVPVGEWLVKVRASSTALEPAALDAKIMEVIAGLQLPASTGDIPAAVPVEPCATTLDFSKRAKPKRPDIHMGLLGALLSTAAEDPAIKAKAKNQAPAIFCREATDAQSAMAAYRANNDADGYLIALGDAGRTINVYRELPLEEKQQPGYGVTLNDVSSSLVFPSFDKLPRPVAVMKMIGSSRPLSSRKRGTKQIDIQAP